MGESSEQNWRILLLDEHADDRRLALLVLRDGCPQARIVEVGGAVEYADALAGGAFTAAVVDPRLGWAAGDEVLAQLRRRCSECAVVVFTAPGGEQEAVRSIRLGAADYLTKSVSNYLRLADAVRQAVQRASAPFETGDLSSRLEELTRRAETLARSNAQLAEFASVVAHDLQEPLRAVQHYTQKLAQRSEEGLTAAGRRNLSLAIEGVNRMQAMIDDLLMYARLGRERRSLQSVDLNAALEEALHVLGPALEAAGASVTHDPLPTLPAEPRQMVQLFQNLIGNAVKFRGSQPPRVHISAKTGEDQCILSIRDNGIGIAPEHAGRIFEVFQRLHTHEEYPGTGMGLAICRQIADNHGGRIWVESAPGQGATFFVALPRGARTPDPPVETVVNE